MYKIKILQAHYEAMAQSFNAQSNVETCCFFLCNDVETPSGALLLVSEVFLLNELDYLEKSSNRLSIDPKTMLSVARYAQSKNFSVCMVHNHPNCLTKVDFSLADNIGNVETFRFFNRMLPGKRNSCLVWNSNLLNASGRVYFTENEWCEIGDIQVHGKLFPLIHNTNEATKISNVSEEVFDRQVRLLGKDGQEKISRFNYGIVGVGGIGSVFSQILTHSGGKNITLIDPDFLEESNLPRVVGSTWDDVQNKVKKVDIAKRYIKTVSPSSTVKAIPYSIEDKRAKESAIELDGIVCCTDNASSRAYLNQLCQQFYIPVLDLGVEFLAKDNGELVNEIGKVNFILPNTPCLHCTGHIHPEDILSEQSSELDKASLIQEGYIKGFDLPEPSMMAFNMQIAARGCQYLLNYVTGLGAFDLASAYEQFSFLGIANRPHIKVIRKRSERTCIYCGQNSSFLGLGSKIPMLLEKTA